ncbi:Stp1/IreP family PP2C-type Ser/Thr phosphatase [bacterium]|nr:Stp1/IreP family PP2C-type Ser/Thr phosphatase [bacterium]
MKINSFGITDIGLVRDKNEDSFYNGRDKNLFIVCDGVGGHLGGEVASSMAVDIISRQEFLEKKQLSFNLEKSFDENGNKLCNLIKYANFEIYHKAQKDESVADMATTLVLLNVFEDKLYITNLGDSRLYYINKHEIVQLTQDHSWVQEQINMGLLTKQQSDYHQYKHVITKALGLEQDIDVEMKILDAKSGFYLLCTDGLTDCVSDNKIKEIVNSCGSNLESSCKSLISEAKLNGSEDNITVLVVKG